MEATGWRMVNDVLIDPQGRVHELQHGLKLLLGRLLISDDLGQTTCPQAGEWGHHTCGWCPSHGAPRFYCGCLVWADRPAEHRIFYEIPAADAVANDLRRQGYTWPSVVRRGTSTYEVHVLIPQLDGSYLSKALLTDGTIED